MDQIPLGLLGISHKTAPVEVREKVALSDTEQREALGHIINTLSADGCMMLSTCNRTEIYVSADDHEEIIEKLKGWLVSLKQTDLYSDSDLFYNLNGQSAAEHFFKVITGIDSQIIGEQQIAGQVKDSYDIAHQLQGTDAIINKLFNFAMQVKKKVHNETFLTDGTVSISFAGVELARKIFSDLDKKSILVVGAGKTAELAAFHFQENGVKNIRVVNRTYQRAQELAEKLSGTASPMEDLPNVLAEADIVISATSSENFVISNDIMKRVAHQRRHQPIFLIDLAIPRDIDPAINEIGGIFLYNLDDLEEIVKQNLEKRKKEIPKSMKIIEDFVDEFNKWYSLNSMNSIVGKLKKRLDTIRLNEIERLKSKLPQNGYRQEIDVLTESIINKVVRQHVKSLKNSIHDPEKYQKQVELILSIYEIDNDK
ncbi:MAG: glutamyl-tRNA reductase [Cyclobacteriaceae bacterium]|nr:glutamyl-tRNA reductase [Cyclobacteriaceae bacterium]